MLARGQRGEGLFVMEKSRRGNVDEIDGIIGEQFVEAAVCGDVGHVQFYRFIAAHVSVDVRKIPIKMPAARVAQSRNFDALHLLVRANMRHRHKSCAHNSNSNLIRHHLPLFLFRPSAQAVLEP